MAMQPPLPPPPRQPGNRLPGDRLRGGTAGIVVMLIVLIVIMFGSLQYFTDNQPQQQVTTGIRDIERSADVSCTANRNAIKTNIVTWQVNNAGEPLRLDELRRQTSLPNCPRGGVYLLGPDGTIYCTKHFPPPAAVMQQLISLTTPTPVPTPFTSPTPFGSGPVATPPPAAATPTPLGGATN